jgi:N-acetylglucosaminyl-diphospho-decaprenol L-rhamnosyltransferase
LIYFITVNYHAAVWITQLIQSIRSSSDAPYHVIVVNNSPDDPAIQAIAEKSVQILETGENLGFGRACNLGLTWVYERDPQAIVWLINPDARLDLDRVSNIEQFFQIYPGISILGTAIYTPDRTPWFMGGRFVPQWGAVVIETEPLALPSADYVTVDWVSGCSLILNFNRFTQCPQFSPDYFLYYEDFDFCRRYGQQGHCIAFSERFSVIHRPSTITDQNLKLKLKHSTFSYLLMLEQHANRLVLGVRFLRLVLYTIVITPFKPQIAFGKLNGISLYIRRVITA